MKKFSIVLFLLLFFSSPTHAAPNEKMIWLGKSYAQFTEAEFQELSGYQQVIINPWHFGGVEGVNEVATKLKSLSSSVNVFPYYSVMGLKLNSQIQTELITQGFNDDWFIRDAERRYLTYPNNVNARYVDLSNANYRTWAINTIKTWLSQAPFDGIALDEVGAVDIILKLKANLPEAKAAAWTDGLNTFLYDLRRAIPGKLIVYNGMNETLPDKNLSYLEHTDMVLNERFCMLIHAAEPRSKAEILQDIETERAIALQGKKVLEKTNADLALSNNLLNKYGRLCYGAFLFGYSPGKTYFKYGQGYAINLDGQNELDVNAKEIDLPLGSPTEQYKKAGYVYKREFTNGIVVVNLESAPEPWTAPRKLNLYNGGSFQKSINTNEVVNVPSRDAVFFLFESENISGDFIESGDKDGDHVNIFDYNVLVQNFGNPYTIFDYNNLVANYGK